MAASREVQPFDNVSALYDVIVDKQKLISALEKAIQIDSARVTDLWLLKFTHKKGENSKAVELLIFIKNTNDPKQILAKVKEFFNEYFGDGRFDRTSIKGVLINQIIDIPPNSKQYEAWAQDLTTELIHYAEMQLNKKANAKVIPVNVKADHKEIKKHTKKDLQKIREEWLNLKKITNTLHWLTSHNNFLVRQLSKAINEYEESYKHSISSKIHANVPGLDQLKQCLQYIIECQGDTRKILIELHKIYRLNSDNLIENNALTEAKGRVYAALGIVSHYENYTHSPALVEKKWEAQVEYVVALNKLQHKGLRESFFNANKGSQIVGPNRPQSVTAFFHTVGVLVGNKKDAKTVDELLGGKIHDNKDVKNPHGKRKTSG